MNRKGFTLVEILAVVALIAVVSVGAIIAVNTMITRQRIKTATASENNIGEAALALQSEKHNLYLPACVDKTSGNYINIPQTTLKKINDDLRLEMNAQGKVTDSQREQFIRDYINTINTNESLKRYFSDTYIGAKDLNCFKVTSVSDMIKNGYLKDLDNGCDRATLIVIYTKGDSAATAGTLKSVQETGICKGSESEEKGPLITVSPEKDLRSSATKTVTVTATANESKLNSNLTLVYGWSKSVRSKPSTWETKPLIGNNTKVTATLSKTGMDEEFYLWIKAGSVKDNKGYSNVTFATGPYAFLPTPLVTYYTKNTDNSFSDPIRGHNRCNGETNCSGKTKKVVFRKLYGQNVEGNTSSLCTPNCTGYKFERWKYEELTINDYSVVVNRNDHTLTAIYSPRSYKITFDANTGNACSTPQKTITFDEPYGTLCLTSKIGYTEVGDWWNARSGGQEIHSYTRMTTAANHSIYKHWRANVFHVAYAGNGATGGSIPTHNCTYDGDCTLKANGFSKTGYTFNGYKKDNTGAALAAGASIKNATSIDGATVTYHAQWCQNCITPSHGSCTLNVSTPGTCKYTTTCNTGYRITSGNATYNPTCTVSVYSITYELGGGSVSPANPTSYTVETNSFTLKNPTKTGYTFAGWSGTGISDKSTSVTVSKGSTGNRSYKANWKVNTYSITYELGGGSVSPANPTSYTLETNSFTLKNPTRTGYTFAGWSGTGISEKSSTVTVSKGSTGNRSYKANWTVNTYSITYELGGGSVSPANPTSYTLETNSFTLNNPTRTGYTFAGWSGTGISDKSTSVTVSKGSTGNRSYKANWKVNTYSITYELGGGSVSSANPTSYTVETNSFTLKNPTKTGYTFAGWSGTGISDKSTSVTVSKGSTGNRSYKANWTVSTYSITYELGGGSVSPANPTSYTLETNSFTLKNPTKTGYTFAGWSGTGISDKSTSVTVSKGSTGNRSYKANWKVNTYSITYTLDSGSVSSANPTSYTVETNSFTLKNPTRTGYTFAGWSGTGISDKSTSVTVSKGSTGDRSYKANWKINIYKITWQAGSANGVQGYIGKSSQKSITVDYEYGKTAVGPVGYTIGASDLTNVVYMKKHAFVKWDKNNFKVTKNETITANWTVPDVKFVWHTKAITAPFLTGTLDKNGKKVPKQATNSDPCLTEYKTYGNKTNPRDYRNIAGATLKMIPPSSYYAADFWYNGEKYVWHRYPNENSEPYVYELLKTTVKSNYETYGGKPEVHFYPVWCPISPTAPRASVCH